MTAVNVCVKATTNRQEISSSHNVYVNVTWLLWIKEQEISNF
jgi:hypothetical protein